MSNPNPDSIPRKIENHERAAECLATEADRNATPPFHGGNRGSNPLGDANRNIVNNINNLYDSAPHETHTRLRPATCCPSGHPCCVLLQPPVRDRRRNPRSCSRSQWFRGCCHSDQTHSVWKECD